MYTFTKQIVNCDDINPVSVHIYNCMFVNQRENCISYQMTQGISV